MNTVYINNLNEKVSVNTLKKELLHLFEKYNVLDIHLKKSIRKKGQAFVSFQNENIDEIIKRFNNYKVLNKTIRVTRAKQDSYELLDQAAIDQRLDIKKYKVFNAPSKLLILNDFDESSVDKQTLAEAFDSYKGYLEYRVIKSKKIAFIEFENKESAAACLEDIPIEKLKQLGGKLSFAKE